MIWPIKNTENRRFNRSLFTLRDLAPLMFLNKEINFLGGSSKRGRYWRCYTEYPKQPLLVGTWTFCK